MTRSLSLLPLALLAASGATLAQSSVTLYGVVDLGLTYTKGSIASKTALNSGNTASSRLGFRGTEDLGGGLNANFVLEADVTPDTGAGSINAAPGVNTSTNNQTVASSGGLTFNRMAWVALNSGFGQVRAGRDYTPSFFVDSAYDPFGLNGLGANIITRSALLTNGVLSVNHQRASNGISYLLPADLGGLRGQVTYAMGEGASGTATSKDGNYLGGRVGYAKGPITADVAHARIKLAAIGDVTTTSLGAGYDFGVVRPTFEYSTDKQGTAGANLKRSGYLLGITAPVGSGRFRASYVNEKITASAAATQQFSQFSVGYVYAMSKRTSLYATLARASNNANANYVLNGAATALGNSSTGFDLGIRHDF